MASFENAVKQCVLVIHSRTSLNLARKFSSKLQMKATGTASWRAAQIEALEMKRVQSFIKNRQHLIANMYQKDAEAEEEAYQNRLDDLHYKSSDLHAREYNRTWTDFSEQSAQKKKATVFDSDEEAPIRRRKVEERPATAKPWDSEAKQFISLLEIRTPLNHKHSPPVTPPVIKYPSSRFESHVTYDGKRHPYV